MERKSPSRMVAEMMIDQGMEEGDAVRALQDRYEAGDPDVINAPNIEYFAQNKFRTRAENLLERTGIELAKMPAYVGSFVSQTMSDVLDGLREEQAALPHDTAAELGAMALSDTALFPLTAPLASAIKIPEAARMFGRLVSSKVAREAIDTGMPLFDMGLKHLRGIERGALGYTNAKFGLQAGMNELLKGSGIGAAIGTSIVGTAAGGILGFAGKKLGQLIGMDPIKRAIEYTARSKGVSTEEILATFDNTFHLRQELVDRVAPQNIIDDLDEVIQNESFKESAKFHTGGFSEPPPGGGGPGGPGGAGPSGGPGAGPGTESPLGPNMGPPVGPGGGQAPGAGPIPGAAEPPIGPEPPKPYAQFRDLKPNLPPNKAPKSVPVAGFGATPQPGGEFIVPPISKFLSAKNSAILKRNPVMRYIKKPLVVDFDPTVETGAKAAIRQVYTDPVEQAKVMGLLDSGIIPNDRKTYNNIVNEFVARKAYEKGYRGIIHRSSSGLDDLVVDLAKFKKSTIGNVDKVIADIEKRVLDNVEPELKPGGAEVVAEKAAKNIRKKLKISADDPVVETPREAAVKKAKKVQAKQKAEIKAKQAASLSLDDLVRRAKSGAPIGPAKEPKIKMEKLHDTSLVLESQGKLTKAQLPEILKFLKANASGKLGRTITVSIGGQATKFKSYLGAETHLKKIAVGAAGAVIGEELFAPEEAEAAPISAIMLRDLANRIATEGMDDFGLGVVKPLVGDLIARSRELGVGINMALRHVMNYRPHISPLDEADVLIDEMEHILTRAKYPGEPILDIKSGAIYSAPTSGPRIIEPGRALSHYVKVYHPALPDIPALETELVQAPNSTTLDVLHMTGLGPAAVGTKFTKSALRQMATEFPGVTMLNPGTRITGTGEKYQVERAGGIIKLLGIPLAIGAALIPLDADQVDAGVIGSATRAAMSGASSRMVRAGLEDLAARGYQSIAERFEIAMDADPSQVLGPEFKRFLNWVSKEKNWGAGFWRSLADASDHPTWIGKFAVPVLDAKEKYQIRMAKEFREKGEKILVDNGLRKANMDKLGAHLEGLDIGEDGVYTQSHRLLGGDVEYDPQYDEVAKQLRREVFDPIFSETKGVDPRYQPLLKRHNLDDTPGVLSTLRKMQTAHEDAGGNIFAVQYPDEVKSFIKGHEVKFYAAAKDLEGMLNFDSTHDLSVKPFEGHFTFQPIQGERGVIEDMIKRIYQIHAPNGAPLAHDKMETVAYLENRLLDLQKMESKMAGPRVSGVVRRKKYFGPLSTGKQLGMVTDTDPIDALNRYVGGAMAKRRFDVSYDAFKGFAAEAKSEDMHGLISLGTTWLDAISGGRAQNDKMFEGIGNAIYKIAGKDRTITHAEIENAINHIMAFHYYAKVSGLLPTRFPMVNLTQTLLTTWSVAGTRATLAGIARAFTREGKELAERHIDILTSPLMGEGMNINANTWSPRRVMDWLPTNIRDLRRMVDYVPGKVEDYNRYIAFHAGRQHFLDTIAKGNKVSRVVKTFVPRKGMNLNAAANEYGKAFVRTTQFIRGAEGRPLATVGSGARGLAGQFKSFPTGYIQMSKDIMRLALTGDKEAIKMLPRYFAALGTLGGMTATTGLAVGIPLYDLVNRSWVAAGHDPLPDKSALGWAAEKMHLYDPLDSDGAAEQVRQFVAAIDVSSGVNPFNFPQARLSDGMDTSSAVRERFVYDLARFVAGPTYGAVPDTFSAAVNLAGKVTGPKEASIRDDESAINKYMRIIKPWAQIAGPYPSGAIEGIQELFEGGVYTESGNLVAQRSGAQILARALNLAPSATSLRGQALRNMEFALINDRGELLDAIIEEAQKQGIVFTAQTMNALWSRVSKTRRLRARGEE